MRRPSHLVVALVAVLVAGPHPSAGGGPEPVDASPKAGPDVERGPEAPPRVGDGHVTAKGSRTPRPLAERFADWVNVRDFGAVGDGVADDTAAIQAAIDASVRGGPSHSARCYIPAGTYRVTSAIVIPDKRLHVFGDGGASLVTGDVPDYIFKRASAAAVEGPLVLEKLSIENANRDATVAGCVRWHGFIVGVLRDLRLVGVNGIDAVGNTFTSTIENCRILNSRKPTAGTSIGIMSVGHANILHTDVVGFDEGIRAIGTGLTMNGCRIEVNGVGLHVGVNRDGRHHGLARSAITALSMEANDTAIWIEGMASTLMSGITFQGSVNSPSRQSKYGLRATGVSSSVLSAITTFGDFSEAAIQLYGTFGQTVLAGVQAANRPGWKVWDVRTQLGNLSFDGCNFKPAGKARESEIPRLSPTLQTGGLAQIDLVRGTEPARNLRGKGQVAKAGERHLDVLFPLDWKAAHAAIAGHRVVPGGGALPAGTYRYRASIVTERGETGTHGEQVVTVPDGAAVELRFYGVGGPADAWRRRVYRSRGEAEPDGYYDLPVGSSSPFVDVGGDFDGQKSPVDDRSPLPGGPEVDANYAVFVAPGWNTTWWITDKATTGFRVHFAAPPETDGTLDWLLVR